MCPTSIVVLTATLLSQWVARAEESSATASASAVAANFPVSATAPVDLSRIELKDGQVLRGRITESDSENVTMELMRGGRMVISRSLISDIRQEKNVLVTRSGEVWFYDPNRIRYLLSPSAMMLRQWEGYFSQTELFGTTVSVGLTSFLTATAGAVVPLWFVKDGGNFIGGVKAGVPIASWLHLAAGAGTLVLPCGSCSSLGFVHGTTTIGNTNLHLSFSVGYPFGFGRESLDAKLTYAISGSARLSRGVSLVSENWVVTFARQDTFFAIGGAVRIFGEHFAADIGLIGLKDVQLPLPWLSFSYTFGS